MDDSHKYRPTFQLSSHRFKHWEIGNFDRRQNVTSRFRARVGIPSVVTQQMVIPGNNLDEILGKPSSDNFQDPTVQCLYMSISLLLIA